MKNSITPLIFFLALMFSFSAYSMPKLNSYPSATATIYLDFNGHNVNSGVWNGGVPFVCASPNMTDAQITEIFNRVSEDYRPFNVNITTDSTVFESAPITNRVRVIVTPTSAWYPGVGGVAYVGSFTWGDDTPCFVFSDRLGPNDPKTVGECCSHESGHTLGLSHQSKFDASCNMTAYYNDGVGSGETSWAPIMGNSYNRNMTGWNNGPTPYGCTIVQDNLSILTSQNGFTYRTDDYTGDLNTTATELNSSSISVDGIIERSDDKDAFKLNITRITNMHLDAKPYSVGANDAGANLDIRLQLFDASNNLIRTYSNETAMSATIDTTLNAGVYYVLVEGTGNSNTSDYGSLGSYALRGSSTVLPIHSIELSGNVDNEKHDLNWNILSDEPIKYITIESSTDGTNFNTVSSVNISSKNFSYTPFENSNIYYRLKVVSTIGQIAYSNVVALKNTGKIVKHFSVSTVVLNDIQVNASSNYQYILNDLNGKVIAKGNGLQGFGRINISGQPKGMYVLQLINNNERQVERIIRQ